MGARDMPWTSEQREWLQALGHDVLLLASADDGASQQSDLPSNRAAPTQSRIATPAAATRQAPSAPSLLRALARAAGRREDDAEFLKAVPDLAALRGNPSARRALWPRLRALRKRMSQ